MAERILSSVDVSIIGKLSTLAGQEIFRLLRPGVKAELKKLRNTVSTIQVVLLDAEEQQEQNQTVRNWLENLKDAFDEADDLRHEVTTRNQKAKKVHIFFSNQLAYGLKMASKIKVVRKRLDAVAVDRKFHSEERPVGTQVRFRAREETQTHSFKLVLDSNVEENFSILSIVGIGGLGKTTLAKLIFNDEEIENHFVKTMWVCVSDNFDVKKVVKKILESVTNEKPAKNLEMNKLVKDLKKEIDGKR